MVALEFDLACVQAHAHLELAELAPRFPVKVALGAQRGRDGVYGGRKRGIDGVTTVSKIAPWFLSTASRKMAWWRARAAR